MRNNNSKINKIKLIYFNNNYNNNNKKYKNKKI